MSNTNDLAGRVFAAIGALAMSATLFLSSFANPTATTFTGMLV